MLRKEGRILKWREVLLSKYVWFFSFKAILHFINQKVAKMGLQVVDMDTQVKKKNKTEKKCDYTSSSPGMTPSSLAGVELCPLFPVCWWCDITAADRTARRLLHPAPWVHSDPVPVLWEGTGQIPYISWGISDGCASQWEDTDTASSSPSQRWGCLHQNLLQIVRSVF